jgi:hypothetical protein
MMCCVMARRTSDGFWLQETLPDGLADRQNSRINKTPTASGWRPRLRFGVIGEVCELAISGIDNFSRLYASQHITHPTRETRSSEQVQRRFHGAVKTMVL